MKPTKSFRAVVAGSAYPRDFTPEDDLDHEAAEIAMAVGALSEEDAAALAAEKSVNTKASDKAPENKKGSKD